MAEKSHLIKQHRTFLEEFGGKQRETALCCSVVQRFLLRLGCCPATHISLKDDSSDGRPCQGWKEWSKQ